MQETPKGNDDVFNYHIILGKIRCFDTWSIYQRDLQSFVANIFAGIFQNDDSIKTHLRSIIQHT